MLGAALTLAVMSYRQISRANLFAVCMMLINGHNVWISMPTLYSFFQMQGDLVVVTFQGKDQIGHFGPWHVMAECSVACTSNFSAAICLRCLNIAALMQD